MKTTTTSTLITAALTAVFATKAFALEAPADDATPPPAAQENNQAITRLKLVELQAKLNAKAEEKTAFLGVVSREVPAAFVDHLNLKNGEGVLVRSVAPDSPAAQAGITTNDVVTKVSGQSVGSPKEISTQIATHQPGETIKIELIHKGQPTTLDITLGTKPAELANAAQEILDSSNLDGFPTELADRVRNAIAGNVMELNLDEDAAQLAPQVEQAIRKLRLQLRVQGTLDEDAARLAPQVEQAIRKLRLHTQGASGQAGAAQPIVPDLAKVESSTATTFKMTDEQGSTELKTQNGAKVVTVRDSNGNLTWEGPWDNAQDEAAAPAEIRQRVEGLHL